jgi:hypothetical protein
MQMPEDSNNSDIREALLQLGKEVKELRQEVQKLSRRPQFPKEAANQTDRLIQGAIWVIIAAAIVSVVSNFTTVILKTLSVNLVG